jgi:hypothetical protein
MNPLPVSQSSLCAYEQNESTGKSGRGFERAHKVVTKFRNPWLKLLRTNWTFTNWRVSRVVLAKIHMTFAECPGGVLAKAMWTFANVRVSRGVLAKVLLAKVILAKFRLTSTLMTKFLLLTHQVKVPSTFFVLKYRYKSIFFVLKYEYKYRGKYTCEKAS